MRTYPAEKWKQLGEWVHDERLRADFADMKDWAAAVKRSTRVLQGLERGEPCGEGTLIAIARTLDRPLSDLIDVLAGATVNVPPATVGGETQTGPTPAWNTRKPDGMSDEEHRRILRETEDYYRWKIQQASEER